ncbi:hypothetical protein [Prosthecomicrobium sp. N25]|uniref:hypothetical protein n=1 Tax=Prosthecomicrobium sp. N25 TaxID=3129254 RepID=UPI003076F317
MAEDGVRVVRERERPALGAVLIIPVLGAALAIYFLVDSSRLVWEARANGTVIGVVLLALVAVQVFRVGRDVAARRATLGLGALADRSVFQFQRVALVVILGVFIAAMPWVGTTLGLFLAMASSMWVLGVRSPAQLVGISFAVAATVYVLFMLLLQSRLPAGLVETAIDALLGRS